MSEDNKFPGPPPPDDFSKTTPNVNLGGVDDGAKNDWNKTNYNFPKQPVADDWGKTVTNIRPIDTSGDDFGNTVLPGSQRQVPQTPDWGLTSPNVRVNPADIGSTPEDFGGSAGYDKTTPYFRLPEAEREKYQNLPPTPTEKAEQEKKEQEAAGGTPGWVWAALGLFGMFVFALVILGAVFFLIYRDSDFEVTVRNAPPGSRILVNGHQWGTTSEDGTRKLTNLGTGKKHVVTIVHPTWECKPHEVESKSGETPNPIDARCAEIPPPPGEKCENFDIGEYDKAERCYNKALDELPDPFTAEQLVAALNILIINFDSGKHDIPQDRLAALKKGAGYIAKFQQREPSIVLEVGGHTDSDGSPAINKPLSERRAAAVKEQLVRFGVNDAGLQTRGYGADDPKVPNDSEKNKFANRRIQYKIVVKR